MEAKPHEITALLERVRSGDRDAENRLYEIVMPHLRRLAQHLLGGERPNHTLQGTELVNQVYLRLAGANLSLRDRSHFFAIAARAMRRELIDYARRRPDIIVLPIDGLPEDALATPDGKRELALTVDELLESMRESMPLECSIVELKFFFGMTDEETAEVLQISPATVKREWTLARAWLYQRMKDEG